jgi:exportin-5
VYEIVRQPHESVVLSIMQKIPNLNITDLQKLDEKILSTNVTGPLANSNQASATTGSKSNKIDKNKKDLFKKITNQLIGRNVLARLFRNPAVINDLHPMNNNSKQKNPNLIDTSADSGIHMQQLFRDVPR